MARTFDEKVGRKDGDHRHQRDMKARFGHNEHMYTGVVDQQQCEKGLALTHPPTGQPSSGSGGQHDQWPADKQESQSHQPDWPVTEFTVGIEVGE